MINETVHFWKKSLTFIASQLLANSGALKGRDWIMNASINGNYVLHFSHVCAPYFPLIRRDEHMNMIFPVSEKEKRDQYLPHL